MTIAISFGGGLYFALLEQPCTTIDEFNATEKYDPKIKTSLCLDPHETGLEINIFMLIHCQFYCVATCFSYSEIYLSWLTGFRLLVQGSIINPFNNGNQRYNSYEYKDIISNNCCVYVV